MKSLVVAVLVAVSAVPAAAETYSWVDEQGTYHFTEDFSQVPKKLRKKVQRRSDMTTAPAEPAAAAKPAVPADNPKKQVQTGAAATGDGKQLYGGRTEAAWRSEIAAQEADLTALERQMTGISDRVKSKEPLGRAEVEALKRQHDEAKGVYRQKYKTYSELLDAARQAGLAVTTKK